jgi:integrase
MKNHLTDEQADQLLEALRGHDLEAIITLAFVTGMRRDELLKLQWQDVDLEKRELRVLHTKTKSSHRMIHLTEGIAEVLKQHQMRQMGARLEAGTAWQNLDLVFPDHAGGSLRPEHLLQGFYEILERAEVPRLQFHDLREARYRTLNARLRAAREGLDSGQTGDLDLDN